MLLDLGEEASARDVALAYYEMGGIPLPAKPKTKCPINGPDGEGEKWGRSELGPNGEVTRETIEGWFPIGVNRSVFLLVGGKGPTVVDADTPEAVAWCDKNLPLTPMIVETGGGGRHYYYAPSKLQSFTVRNGNIKIDFKASGGVIAFPSVHKSGKKYKLKLRYGVDHFDDFPAVTQEDYVAIQNATEPQLSVDSKVSTNSVKLSKCNLSDLAGQRVPTPEIPHMKGTRNNALASLVGQWIHDPNIGLDIAKLHAKAMAWNRTNKPPLSETEVAATIMSIVKGDVTKRAREQKPISIDPAPVPIANIHYKPWKPPAEDAIHFEDKLLEPPGVLNDIKNYILDTAPTPEPLLAVQGTLALASVSGSRIWCTDTNNNFTSLYFVSVAATGVGKDRPQSAIFEILKKADLQDLIGPDGYTGQTAVMDALEMSPSHITILDEIGDYLKSAKSGDSTHIMMSIRSLKSAFGKLDSVLIGKGFSQRNMQSKERHVSIIKPGITLFGSTTPKAFYSSLDDTDIEGGLLNRMIIAETNSRPRLPRTIPPKDVPPHIIDLISQIRNRGGNLGKISGSGDKDIDQNIIKIHPESQKIYDRMFHELQKKQNRLEQMGLEGMLNRTREKSMRLGAACSLWAHNYLKENPVLTPDIAKWATHYVWTSDMQTISSIQRKMGTPYGRTKMEMLEKIRKSGPKGMTLRDMGRIAIFKNTRASIRKEIMVDLQASNDIMLSELKSGTQNRIAWIALAEDKDEEKIDT